MLIKKFSNTDCTQTAYDLRYFALDFADAPVHGMLCTVEPQSSSRIHNHVEVEFFYFVSGAGKVHSDSECVDVKAGEGVRIDAFANHIIENTSHTIPLQFISFYWINKESDPEVLPEIPEQQRTLIFSTPPTPNGDLHLGHLSGPYLASDIYRRHLLGLGTNAYHVTGRDDHQTYVATKAKIDGYTPEQTADKYARQIRETWQQYDIPLDYFIEPSREGAYTDFVNQLLIKLYDSKYIIEKTEDAAVDSETLNYVHEAYIRGKCPHCQHESDGNACEECGMPNQCTDLTDAYVRLTQHKIVKKPIKRLYFRFSLLSKMLSEYIQVTPMSAHAYALSQRMLAEGLPDICISHPSDWGMSVPVPGFSNQVLYVWFEMAFGYLWAARNLAPANIQDDLEKIHWFYQNNCAKIVHFYGFDNTFYHTLLFPAVYFALGGIKPPAAHLVNELLDLDGKKFSTSRGHLISGKALLESAPLDYVRWFLCEVRPEGIRSNFQLNAFYHSVNTLFAEQLQGLIVDLKERLAIDFEGKVPEPGAWTTEQRYFYQELLGLRQAILQQFTLEKFSLRGVSADLRRLIVKTMHFQTCHMKFFTIQYVRDNLRTTLALSLFALKLFALLARPIIPHYAKSILQFLGLDADLSTHDTDFIPSGIMISINKMPNFPCLQENIPCPVDSMI